LVSLHVIDIRSQFAVIDQDQFLRLISPHGNGYACAMGKITFVILLLVLTVALGSNHARGQSHPAARDELPKITLGVVEDVILGPWGISFPARIDTGADLSSLDARELVVRNNVADFKLGKRWGSRRLQLPVVEWTHVQTAMGIEKRPVVEISICLGAKLFNTLATLKDRSEMTYPFLVGRSALNGVYLVDTSRSRTAQPTCSVNS
jgi:hypothetical protein